MIRQGESGQQSISAKNVLLRKSAQDALSVPAFHASTCAAWWEPTRGWSPALRNKATLPFSINTKVGAE